MITSLYFLGVQSNSFVAQSPILLLPDMLLRQNEIGNEKYFIYEF
ncbi:hypothetical protein [Flavobacterium psychrophilum]|nr:hypothetical protein [Flavobacterium psychrophilum]